MTYDELLAGAPAHDTPEFLKYLRDNNVVVLENGTFLIIRNIKYWQEDRPWLTCFFKCKHFPYCSCARGALQLLDEKYGDWEWLKKSTDKQTVKRYHIHIHK